MDELKKWLLNRIYVAKGKAGLDWKERLYTYVAVLEKIEQIESDGEFDKWYESHLIDSKGWYTKSLCRQSWEAGLKYANKTGQD